MASPRLPCGLAATERAHQGDLPTGQTCHSSTDELRGARLQNGGDTRRDSSRVAPVLVSGNTTLFHHSGVSAPGSRTATCRTYLHPSGIAPHFDQHPSHTPA